MDKKTYRSKIGLELVIPLTLVLGTVMVLPLLLGATFRRSLPSLFVVAACSLFIAHIFKKTYYTIENTTLHIKSGFLYDSRIDIHTIRKIRETRNPLSSPAASLDRLELFYNKFDSVMISPKDKQGFVEHLLQINPGIELKWRD